MRVHSLGLALIASLAAGCGTNFNPGVVCSLSLTASPDQTGENFGSLPVGETFQLIWHASDCQGDPIQVPVREVTFTSVDTLVAVVAANGIVTARRVGQTVLRAEVGSASGSFFLTVTQ
jgi:hypothetical protein